MTVSSSYCCPYYIRLSHGRLLLIACMTSSARGWSHWTSYNLSKLWFLSCRVLAYWNLLRWKFMCLVFFMFCWPCISIRLCSEDWLDALFILSLFHQSTSTCFGHICSPSSGGMLYIRGDADKSLARPGRKQVTATKLRIYSTYSPWSSTLLSPLL